MGLGNLKAGPKVGPGNGKGEICLALEKWDFGGKIKWENIGNRRALGNLCTRGLEKGGEKSKYNGKQMP